MVISEARQLISQDLTSWLRTAGFFLIPVAVIYITAILNNMGDGFTWNDFIPTLIVQGSIVSYLLNELLALFRKWNNVNQYLQ